MSCIRSINRDAYDYYSPSQSLNNADDLHEALYKGWLPPNTDFLINWIGASKELRNESLDWLLGKGYLADSSFYYLLPSLMVSDQSTADYVATLIYYQVPFPEGVSVLTTLILMDCEIRGLKAVLDKGEKLTADDLKAAGNYYDPVGLMRLCFCQKVVLEGYVAEGILATIRKVFFKDHSFNHELVCLIRRDNCRTTTLNLALWLQAPLMVVKEIHLRGAALDCFSCMLINRHPEAVQLKAQLGRIEEDTTHPVMNYLCALPQTFSTPPGTVDESHLHILLRENPRCHTTLLNVLLFYKCSPGMIRGIVQRGASPDAMSCRLVEACPELKEALTPVMPER